MKRFTETEKWRDPWFMELSVVHKTVWLYLVDNCDHSGVIEINPRLISFVVGSEVDCSEFQKATKGRVVTLQSGKWFIVPFIKFQYGDTLNPSNCAHNGVIKRLEHHGLTWPLPEHIVAPAKGLPRGCLAPQVQDKEEVQVQEKEKRKVFSKPEMPELEFQAQKIGLPSTEITKFQNYYESNGWRVGKNPMKSWRSAMQNWKTNYDERRYNQTHTTNHRNDHVIRGPTDYAAAAKRKVEREQGEAASGLVPKVAENGNHPPPITCPPERSSQLLRELRQASQ